MAGSAATNVPGTVVAVYNLAIARPARNLGLVVRFVYRKHCNKWQQKQNDRFQKSSRLSIA